MEINIIDLNKCLHESLHTCYILFGKDLFLLQQAKEYICIQAKLLGFHEILQMIIDKQTNWEVIFNLCRIHNLFNKYQILVLTIPDINLISLDEKLNQLSMIIHDNIIVIIIIMEITVNIINTLWYKNLDKKIVLVKCIDVCTQIKPIDKIINKAKELKLFLDTDVAAMLNYYYEGNNLALNQILIQLSLIYTNQIITINHVKEAINNCAHYTPFNLLDAILSGNIKRVIQILHQLKLDEFEPMMLLRIIQKDVILLLFLKRNFSKISKNNLFDKYNIWKQRQHLIMQALKRLSLNQLSCAVNLLLEIELDVKEEFNLSIWFKLDSLSLILCGYQR